jgi:hypothetical protein
MKSHRDEADIVLELRELYTDWRPASSQIESSLCLARQELCRDGIALRIGSKVCLSDLGWRTVEALRYAKANDAKDSAKRFVARERALQNADENGWIDIADENERARSNVECSTCSSRQVSCRPVSRLDTRERDGG